MDIVLPEQQNEQKFLEYASHIQYDEFNAKMFVFYTGASDVDVYQLMADDRLLQLIYGWNVCRVHSRQAVTVEVSYIVKVLAHHTLQLWFSQEWMGCSESLKRIVLYYLSKASIAFRKIDGLCDFDWQYILNFQTSPWRLPYLQQLFANLSRNKHHVIEHAVPPATLEDVTFLMQERLHLIILRLVKLFDSGSWEAVKQLSLRVLAAWLRCNAQASSESLQRDQASIALVGHLYLLTVFVADDNRGYVIDNMMYNIRFYAQSMQQADEYTPARLIAQVCVRLGLGKDGFFESIVFKRFNLSLITPFAVMLKTYTSYVLGNQLLELMALNEHDFMQHMAQFKVLMNHYVEERENSEQFLLNELQKLEAQRHSHALPHTVNLNLNYQQQICKGNRASNIGNYKNCDDDEKPLLDGDEELDRQIDPVFQNVPNNENVLDFVYQLLAKRKFRGWQFAKIALLLKIIGQKLNTIEVWRYHPGLTTEFMLNLEHKLSENYADLARVFTEHGFMEAEFWLTAFYLHPTRTNYAEVKRCSRIKKKRKDDEELPSSRAAAARTDKSDNIKYELLSSTIDVDEIVTITNHNAPVADYDPVYKALQGLRLPRSILKDLLTVAFQPRNKRYSWALEWNILHERCSALLKSTDLKRKFVALNMAEANDRLKFLKIDYNKYKNRPQLDYGTIEEGYENAAGAAEGEASEEEAQEKAEKEKKRKRRSRYWDEIISEEEEDEEEEASDESESYYTGTGRRTRIRAAAIVANAMISDMDRTMRSGRRSPTATATAGDNSVEEEEEATSTAPQVATETTTSTAAPKEPSEPKRSFCDVLQAQAKYSNETNGFKAFSDIWSFEKDKLISVDKNNELMESNSLLSKFKSLQGLRQRTQQVFKDEPERARSGSRCNSEADSSHSGTSTMALHDSNEFEEAESGVSKELTPPPGQTSDLTMETEVLQLGEKVLTTDGTAGSSEVGTVTATKVETDTEPSKSDEPKNPKQPDDSGDTSLNSRLIQECLTRRLEVRLDMLTTMDIEKLRRLRVLVKRTNFVDYYQQQKRIRSTSSSRKSQTQTEESNESTTNVSEQDATGKQFVHITSDTPAPSRSGAVPNPRFKQFKRFKHITSDSSSSSTDPDESSRAASMRRRRGAKLNQKTNKAKPKVHKRKHVTADSDVIELSSDSISSTSPVPVAANRFPAMAMPRELDPLYEEEIVPF
ncbi:hypothetical protein KR222_010959 [Zaprionus bogoriensis]|nr:hypothetical protein KR222_010959 [Zaprionus bogoriensis]